jgi:hypothetical protein
MERWFNDTDSGKLGYAEQKPFLAPLFHHKSQMDWSGTELGLSRFETSNETPVMHDLQHTSRAGHEMVAKPATLAL